MNKLLKKLTQIALIFSMFFAAASFAEAASFDTNPSNTTGIVSVGAGGCGSNCGGINDSLMVNIPNPGDSTTVNIFADYMSRRNSGQVVTNPRVYFHTKNKTNQSNSIYSFRASLSASNASGVSDTARVTNLPSSYKIEFLSGHVENGHGDISMHPGCNGNPAFSYYSTSNISSFFVQPGRLLGDLGTAGGGYCDQGTAVVKYKITNTEQAQPAYTYTWDNGNWGTCINGVQTRDIWCVQNPGGATVSNSYCPSAQRPATSQSCPLDLDVTTLSPQVNTANVVLNGRIQTGSSSSHYFVLGNGPDISCTAPGFGSNDLYTFASSQNGVNLSAPSSFSHTIQTSLPTGTYYYRACAGFDLNPSQGNIQSFTISSTPTPTYAWHTGSWSSANANNICTRTVTCRNNNGTGSIVADSYCPSSTKPATSQNCGGSNNNTIPQAETYSESSVTTDSARLRGRVRMNDIDDGKVFFVYGRDESDIQDIPSYFDTYGSINTSGVNKVIVDNSNDTDAWRNYSRNVTGLSTDKRYYYRMCVEFYRNGNDDIVCGNIQDFRTDDDAQSNNDSEIYVREVTDISKNSAKVCGELTDDGGNGTLRTWMEIRRSNSNTWNRTSKVDRGERKYCETVNNLNSNTKYYYRACSDDECSSSRFFTTSPDAVVNNKQPYVTTDIAYNIKSNSAVLPGTYLSNATRASVWFRYGRTQNLTNTTTRYTKYGTGGQFTHNFTNLKSNQLYCYQAVIQTTVGTDYGAVRCFTTRPAAVINNNNTRVITRVVEKPVIVETVVEDNDKNIDLSRLGLGLSLVRLKIDDGQETVSKNQTVTYEIQWENISELNLTDLDLNISIPKEIQITSSSRGRLDQDRNSIFYTIPSLRAGERGSMTVTGNVVSGNIGNTLTADATLAFANPVNQAQENATDYDVNGYVSAIAGIGTASVFGLSNITFLGWLTILLGLLIVFLVARWLYLEREELRAQAYVNGYGRAPYIAPVDHRYGGQPVRPVQEARYVEPAVSHNVSTNTPAQTMAPQNSVHPTPAQTTQQAVVNADERPDYRPYRPNRG